MTYETVAAVSQVTSLFLFIALFFVVLGYALWPKNGERFQKAQRSALDLSQDDVPNGGGR